MIEPLSAAATGFQVILLEFSVMAVRV